MRQCVVTPEATHLSNLRIGSKTRMKGSTSVQSAISSSINGGFLPWSPSRSTPYYPYSASRNRCRNKAVLKLPEGRSADCDQPIGLTSGPSGRLTIMVIEHSAQPLTALDHSTATDTKLVLDDQSVA